MISAIKRILPVQVKTPIRIFFDLLRYLRKYRRDWVFKNSLPANQRIMPFPPAMLRFRVQGHFSAEYFHNDGKKLLHTFDSALKRCNYELDMFHSILDFGTGCGRLMRWMQSQSVHAKLYGC